MQQSRDAQRVASAGLCDFNVVSSQAFSGDSSLMIAFALLLAPHPVIGAAGMHRLPLCQARACPFARVELFAI